MQQRNDQVLYSASDIVAFLGCKHRTQLDLRKLSGWDETPTPADDAMALVQAYGDRHEQAYLQTLKNRGLQIVEINKQAPLEEQIEATRQAMRDGAQVIFQAALLQSPFLGYADFLFKVDGQSKLGHHHYEVADTKLAKSNRAKFMVQLCFYADLLEQEQGGLPRHLHVVLGKLDEADKRKRGLAPQDENTAQLLTDEYIHHFRQIKADFLAFTANPPTTEALPNAACGQCGWRDHCQKQWESQDHVCLVANIRRDQIDKLAKSDITTMKGLAAYGGEVKGIGVLDKLKIQAQLQSQPLDANGQRRIHHLAPSLPVAGINKAKGFALLPEPDAGDLYFDMEGFPHETGGLEYLFGVGYAQPPSKPDQGATLKFEPFWAHNRQEEKAAFEAFMDFVEAHLIQHPKAHIYHYAAYEKTAIQKLSSVHDTRTELRDRLLREGRLVDLYRVVGSGLALAVPSYSIKKVEAYYRSARAGAVANAGESIVMYEAFRETTDASEQQRLLADIESYNKDDVESTWQLHQWLESLRPAGTPYFSPAAQEPAEQPKSEHQLKREAAEAKAREARALWLAGQPAEQQAQAQKVAELLSHLLGFYWRCALPGIWRQYQRQASDESELLDDMECLALLTSTGQVVDEALSKRYFFRVPDQETKLATGSDVTCLSDGMSVSNFVYDPDRQEVSFTRRSNREAPPHTITVCAADRYNDAPKLAAIHAFIERLSLGQEAGGPLLRLLSQQRPHLTGRASGQAILSESPTPEAVLDAVRQLDGSHLVIQGPPGTGKTTTAAHVIAALIAEGKNVAITANSHAAINHLLAAAYKRTQATHTPVHAVVVKADDALPPGIKVIRSDDLNPALHRLAGGTAWLFCRTAQTQEWDYLFVDEASQLSLADALAAGSCARNIVLLGDQMQLPQPTEGTHPGDSGLSVLDYLMQGHATVPAEQGIFLGITHRMHPDVCKPISEGVYEGRLVSAAECAAQGLVLNATADPALKAQGVVHVPVPHAHRSQSAPEEAQRIKQLFDSLLQQHWIDRNGATHPITPRDILVVAPYNAQVRELRRALGNQARVGTVDKFQGQEAAVAIVSMTTSDADNLPRSLDFLFNKNRLNVAVSRAKCLALVVASPGLQGMDCGTVEEMGLLSFYARLVNPDDHDLSKNNAQHDFV
jgi:uncharacterized protein